MEQSPVNVFSPSRDTGIGIQNTAHEKRMTWALGLFRGDTDKFGDGFSDDGNYDLTTRVTGLLHWSEDGERYVHLGASYSHQFRGAERLRYRARPSAHLADRLVDTEFPAPGTANLITDGVDLFNAEFAWVHGPFSLQGEGILSHVDVDNGASRDFWGAYAQASWFLTGEHRAYNQDRGTFGRTSPIQNFDLWQGHWGAWEIAARYSFLDLDDGSIQGGKLHDVVAGLNWYLFPNARIMWNYVYAHVNGGGDFNGGEMRFALDF